MSPPIEVATLHGGPAAPSASGAGLAPCHALRLAYFWLGGLCLVATVMLPVTDAQLVPFRPEPSCALSILAPSSGPG